MNLKQFKYVLVLSQEGSFSAAAEVLNISQPSLSQYVKKIENEIGMPLFDRTGGLVRLTDAGEAYIDAGRRILDIERQMQGRFNDIRENKTGTIRIGTSPFRSASAMPRIAKTFKEKNPGVCLEIHENDTASLMEGLAHGEFDVCLTMLPVDENLFEYEKIFDEEIVLAVPARLFELDSKKKQGSKYPAIDFRCLNGKEFVMLTEMQYMQRVFDNMCAEYGVVAHRNVSVKSLETQIEMVKAGLGMAVVPDGVRAFCDEDEVRFYSFEQDMPSRKVVAVWRRDVEPTSLVRELIDIIKECSKNNF